jgi:hypothetical protein
MGGDLFISAGFISTAEDTGSTPVPAATKPSREGFLFEMLRFIQELFKTLKASPDIGKWQKIHSRMASFVLQEVTL